MAAEMDDPTRQGVNITGGDKGVDRSQTTVDASSRVASTVDDHSVHTSTTTDNSTRTVHVNASDNRRKSSVAIGGGSVAISGGTMASVVALIAVVLVVFWLVPRGGVAPAAPAQTVYIPAPAVQSGQPGAAQPADAKTPDTTLAETRSAPVEVAPANLVRRPFRDAEPAPPVAPPAIAPDAKAREPVRLDPAQFINRGMLRPGLTAVLMVDERRGFDALLTQQVAALVGGADGLFKPAFVREGLFSRVHQGDADLLRELGVTGDVARVLLGIRSVSFSPVSVAGEALVRATVALSVRVLRPGDGFASSTSAAREIGAGFDEDAALALATENAVRKLGLNLARD